MKPWSLRTKDAFVIAMIALTAGFVFSTFKSGPYAEFAAAVVAVFGGYGYKRLKQREERYQPNGNGEGEEGKVIPSDRPAIKMVMEKPKK